MCFLWGALAAAQVVGDSANIQVDQTLSPGEVQYIFSSPSGNVVHTVQFPVPPATPAPQLATMTAHALANIPGVDPASVTSLGDLVRIGSTPLFDPLDGVFPGGTIRASGGTTGQDTIRLLTPEIGQGIVGFQGFFAPGPIQQPAIFTAGIVTDVGELTAQVSAQELTFQTDGPIICQALFQRLAPRAPQYGAQINYAGDRLEIYFDPAYTVTQGGIIFGTSSTNSVVPFGSSGQIITPPPPKPGDFNGDGVVDQGDLGIFLANFGKYEGATFMDGDNDGDGDVDGEDFLGLLENFDFGQPHTGAVPEPGALLLAVIVGSAIRRRRPKRGDSAFRPSTAREASARARHALEH
jgi:hypothetical protein